MTEKQHYHGHRARLRKRFLSGGANSLADYEKLELLLFAASVRGDMKPVAKRLLETFGSIGDVLTAEPRDLLKVNGIGETAVTVLKTAEMASIEILRHKAIEAPKFLTFKNVIDYCRSCMSRLKTEQLRLLFMDARQKLIKDEVHQQGTVQEVNAYAREIVKRALDLGAASVILVHNHPSGESDPSKADIDFTLKVQDALETVEIDLLDHIIIGKTGHTSLKKLGYI